MESERKALPAWKTCVRSSADKSLKSEKTLIRQNAAKVLRLFESTRTDVKLLLKTKGSEKDGLCARSVDLSRPGGNHEQRRGESCYSKTLSHSLSPREKLRARFESSRL